MTAIKHILIVLVVTLVGAVLAAIFGLPLMVALVFALENEPLLDIAYGILFLTPFATILMIPIALGAAVSLSSARKFVDPYHPPIIGISVGTVWGCIGGFFLYWFFQGEANVMVTLAIGIIAGIASGLVCAELHTRLWRWLP